MQTPSRETLTTAAFMAIGLQHAIDISSGLLDHFGGGHYELVHALTEFAPYSDALLEAGFQLMGSCPGVAAYEVAEEFGAWFGAQVLACDAGQIPTSGACRSKLRTLVTTFYKPMRSGQLSAVLMAVPVPESAR